MKICSKCKELKELTEFYSTGPQCKSCIKSMRKQYYKENKGKVLNNVKLYRENNKEKCLISDNRKQRRNPEVYKKIRKRYYESHKEQLKEKARKHRAANPEAYRTYCRNRREWRKNLKENYNKEDAKYTYTLFNNQCANCGDINKLEIDHHYPLATGNVLTRKNAVLLCRSCNAKKHIKTPEKFYSEDILKKINFLLAK